MHAVLSDGHRLSRYRAKVKPVMVCRGYAKYLPFWLLPCSMNLLRVCGQSQTFSGVVRVVEVNVSS